jgi:hypothetical protein
MIATLRNILFLRQLLVGKYSKWIEILQEFELKFEKPKSKRSLVFAELICDLPSVDKEKVAEDYFCDESLFLISSDDIWYGDIIVYLQIQNFWSDISHVDHYHIRYQALQYIILGDTIYHRGIDFVFRRSLTYDEDEKALNDCHFGACGNHMSGYAIAQKILRAGYLWPSLFKDSILIV